ncbi:MAG TPA: protein kinase [Candidatus Sulfotelmatobacter sp.]|nr:protein kinase [Candidatus Sulfotelmatobacter sp.]
MERVGRYEILAEVGRGAMGRVYQARDPEIDRLVAIKVMVLEAGLDEGQAQEWRRRFQREGRAAGRLSHPAIVAIYDVGEDAGRPYLVMEFVRGQTLEQVLRAEGPVPLARAVDIVEQVARALDYAHRHGIVHRDVKPANILLTDAGAVKIGDFGIARLAGAELTSAGHVWGTPSYMSPEQVTGRPLDGRSDLFSLGTVLYELLSGEKPFPGETVNSIAYRIVHEEPTPLRRLNPGVPPGLAACLARALSKDPARRHARAAEFAADVKASLAPGRPTATSATTVKLGSAPLAPSGAKRPARRWPWLAAGGVAVAGLLFLSALPRGPRHVPPPSPANTLPVPATAAPSQTADEESRRTEGERLARERAQLDQEKARLAREQAALDAERKKAEAARSQPAPTGAVPPAASPSPPVAARQVSRVRFSGNAVVPSAELEALIAPDAEVTPASVHGIVRSVGEYYRARGYSLARAIPVRWGPDGVLEIEVQEGRVDGLRTTGLTAEEQRWVQAAFASVLQSRVFQRQTLAEALRRLVEQHGLAVQLRFEAGVGPGGVGLVIGRSPSGKPEWKGSARAAERPMQK